MYILLDEERVMISKLIKIGNSLCVRLPAVFTKELKLSDNSPIEIKNDKEQIIITPIELKNYDSKELFSKISEENLHSEIQTGKAIGREVW
jgi:antitoxin MazE